MRYMYGIVAVTVTLATIIVAALFSNSAVNTFRAEIVSKLDSIQKDMSRSSLAGPKAYLGG